MVLLLLIPWAVVRKSNSKDEKDGGGGEDALTDTDGQGSMESLWSLLGAQAIAAAPAMTWKRTVCIAHRLPDKPGRLPPGEAPTIRGFGEGTQDGEGREPGSGLNVAFERWAGSVFLSCLHAPLLPSLLMCITLLGSKSHWNV